MRRTQVYLAFVVLLLVAGCAGSKPVPTEPADVPTAVPTRPAPEPTAVAPSPTSETLPERPTPTKPVPPEPAGLAGYSGRPLPVEWGELFAASGACASCHTGMVDESGADVSIDAFWRSTMMANAARDPYWLASVREEVLDHPDYQATIEDTCAKCHMPMARFTAVALGGGAGQVLDTGFLDTEHEHHTLAMDGVSCTLCHQVEETGFGEATSFTAGFVIDTDLPLGERLAYGLFPVDEPQAAAMQVASGFIPVEGPHVERAELCATCHTLYTPYIDAAGQVAGQFPEQTPYLEWRHSGYRDSQACQGCHMPVARGAVQLSITGGPPRSPFSQHLFVGGNAYVLSILRAFGEELDVTASSEHFGDKIARVVDQLENRTASLALEDVEVSGSRLAVTVAVQGWAGHKFPTGYPSRRAWLHFTVQDSDGRILFESGAVGSDGSIVGNDNDADPAAYEPHYRAVVSPDQVQIYEAILQNTEGGVTTALLRASRYVKDNRLLPSGFDKHTAPEDVAVRGEAAEDEDFLGGEDRVQYEVELGDAQGPFAVIVDLLYQSLGYRWVQNLRRNEAPEITRFLGYYEAVPNLPVIVASTTIVVEE